ncbi:VOC family protein [uncultured Algimonas sp.]|uniref:VOC family protein n=1 Tax=uncultured Algimonas sp. TaxID=1547920 RepID=UPI00261F4FF5|nr:VOC family protein [uncultured Algimonas sp.]
MTIPADHLRAAFSDRLSDLYRREVPAYGTLLDIVAAINGDDSGTRLGSERHGAIRVGQPSELRDIARLFGAMGMHPVGYYDLSVAGLPVHSTAFRPVAAESFAISPFRMFTSLLRPAMIADDELRAKTLDTLEGRDILPERGRELLEKAESDDGLRESAAHDFVDAAVSVFAWRPRARVGLALYRDLLDVHRLIADIVSFQGPHMNHLTPRVKDIDAAQGAMRDAGLEAKDIIEGPPTRRCPILLRQTAFKALSEQVEFKTPDGWESAAHTARFGEIEQRGAALTPKGRALYDECLARAKRSDRDHDRAMADAFADFPDDWEALRASGLAYFGANGHALTYEDFLPVSAAGIFRSNLRSADDGFGAGHGDQAGFERAMGRECLDMFALYAADAA